MDDNPPRDVADADAPEVFTDLTAWMAQLVVLKDAGHLPNVSFGEDEESQRFVADVRTLNRDWELGEVAVVPRAPVIQMDNRPRPMPRPREGRPRRRVARRTARTVGSRGDPSRPSEPDRPLRVIDLTVFRRDVAEWLGAA